MEQRLMKQRRVKHEKKCKRIFHVLLHINILLLIGMAIVMLISWYEEQKPEVAVITNEFDQELADVRAFLEELDEEPLFIMLKDDIPEVYEEWNLVTKMQSKFGYKEDEWGISIIVGSHDGTQVREARFSQAYNPQVVEITGLYAESNNLIIDSAYEYKPETRYFTFQIGDTKYLVDNQLNTWKIS